MAEIAWALEARLRLLERTQIAGCNRTDHERIQLQIESSTEVARGPGRLQGWAGGFADCLIGQTNRTAECRRTVTFDRKAAKLDTFELLKSS